MIVNLETILRGDDGFNYYLLAGSVGCDNYNTSRQIAFGAVDRLASGAAMAGKPPCGSNVAFISITDVGIYSH